MRFRPSEIRFAADRVEDGVAALENVAIAAGVLITAWRVNGQDDLVGPLLNLEDALCELVGAQAPAGARG